MPIDFGASTMRSLLAAAFCIFLAGCCTSRFQDEGDLHDMQVYLRGTKEYDTQAATFKFSQDQVTSIEGSTSFIGSLKVAGPGMIVGHFYVFSNSDNGTHPLQGVYIDGNTGGVQFVDSKYIVKKDLFGNPCVTLP